jgi:predicted dehydrogenase
MSVVRWAILGPGAVARDFFAGARGSATGTITAIATRNVDRPGLRTDFPGTRILRGYDALLTDPDIDAIYVATPHTLHAKWVVAAARAGKHVLCEKPMGVTATEVAGMFDAAAAAGTFLGEAYMYRSHPLTMRIIDLVQAGEIGDLRLIRSSMGFVAPSADPASRLFSPTLGGGAILDVGGYPLSMARLLAGCQIGAEPIEPTTLRAVTHVGPTGVDEWACAVLAFPNGVLAELSCSISLRQDNVLHLMGTAGRMEIDQFWFAGGKSGGVATIRSFRHDGNRQTFAVAEPRSLYSFQFEAANDAIGRRASTFSYPAMTAADSLNNARSLDAWLEARGPAVLKS